MNPDERTAHARARPKARRVLCDGPCSESTRVRWARERPAEKRDGGGGFKRADEGLSGWSRARVRRKRFLGLRHGLRVGVREGETLSPGCFGSTCARGLGECFRGASGEATYGEWVGVMGRSVPQFACTGHDTPSTERPDPKLRN